MAKTHKTSVNRILVDLLEAGLQFKDAEKERFLAMANQLAESSNPAERQRLQKELARITFRRVIHPVHPRGTGVQSQHDSSSRGCRILCVSLFCKGYGFRRQSLRDPARQKTLQRR